MTMRLFMFLLLGGSLFPAVCQPDPGCEPYKAWINQANPTTDTTGFGNNNFPEASSTTY